MNKKEILIIFVLAVLVTVGTAFWEMARRDIFSANYEYGFPLDFFSVDWFFIGVIDPLPFVLNVFFWFLVIFAIWRGIQLAKKKRV